MPSNESTRSDSPADVDFSVIRTAIEMGHKMIEQILNGIHYGSDEARHLLREECDYILECKVCRNLFRSFPNFVAHKRVYCVELFEEKVEKDKFATRIEEETIVIQPEIPTESRLVSNSDKGKGKKTVPSGATAKQTVIEKVINRTFEGKSKNYQFYTKVAENEVYKKASRQTNIVTLTSIPTNSNAVIVTKGETVPDLPEGTTKRSPKKQQNTSHSAIISALATPSGPNKKSTITDLCAQLVNRKANEQNGPKSMVNRTVGINTRPPTRSRKSSPKKAVDFIGMRNQGKGNDVKQPADLDTAEWASDNEDVLTDQVANDKGTDLAWMKLCNIKQLRCKACDKRFTTAYSLKLHVKMKHGDGFKCTECNNFVYYFSSLMRHMQKNHHKSRAFLDKMLENRQKYQCINPIVNQTGKVKIVSHDSSKLNSDGSEISNAKQGTEIMDIDETEKTSPKTANSNDITKSPSKTGLLPYATGWKKCDKCDKVCWKAKSYKKHYLRCKGKSSPKTDSSGTSGNSSPVRVKITSRSSLDAKRSKAVSKLKEKLSKSLYTSGERTSRLAKQNEQKAPTPPISSKPYGTRLSSGSRLVDITTRSPALFNALTQNMGSPLAKTTIKDPGKMSPLKSTVDQKDRINLLLERTNPLAEMLTRAASQEKTITENTSPNHRTTPPKPSNSVTKAREPSSKNEPVKQEVFPVTQDGSRTIITRTKSPGTKPEPDKQEIPSLSMDGSQTIQTRTRHKGADVEPDKHKIQSATEAGSHSIQTRTRHKGADVEPDKLEILSATEAGSHTIQTRTRHKGADVEPDKHEILSATEAGSHAIQTRTKHKDASGETKQQEMPSAIKDGSETIQARTRHRVSLGQTEKQEMPNDTKEGSHSIPTRTRHKDTSIEPENLKIPSENDSKTIVTKTETATETNKEKENYQTSYIQEGFWTIVTRTKQKGPESETEGSETTTTKPSGVPWSMVTRPRPSSSKHEADQTPKPSTASHVGNDKTDVVKKGQKRSAEASPQDKDIIKIDDEDDIVVSKPDSSHTGSVTMETESQDHAADTDLVKLKERVNKKTSAIEKLEKESDFKQKTPKKVEGILCKTIAALPVKKQVETKLSIATKDTDPSQEATIPARKYGRSLSGGSDSSKTGTERVKIHIPLKTPEKTQGFKDQDKFSPRHNISPFASPTRVPMYNYSSFPSSPTSMTSNSNDGYNSKFKMTVKEMAELVESTSLTKFAKDRKKKASKILNMKTNVKPTVGAALAKPMKRRLGKKNIVVKKIYSTRLSTGSRPEETDAKPKTSEDIRKYMTKTTTQGSTSELGEADKVGQLKSNFLSPSKYAKDTKRTSTSPKGLNVKDTSNESVEAVDLNKEPLSQTDTKQLNKRLAREMKRLGNSAGLVEGNIYGLSDSISTSSRDSSIDRSETCAETSNDREQLGPISKTLTDSVGLGKGHIDKSNTSKSTAKTDLFKTVSKETENDDNVGKTKVSREIKRLQSSQGLVESNLYSKHEILTKIDLPKPSSDSNKMSEEIKQKKSREVKRLQNSSGLVEDNLYSVHYGKPLVGQNEAKEHKEAKSEGRKMSRERRKPEHLADYVESNASFSDYAASSRESSKERSPNRKPISKFADQVEKPVSDLVGSMVKDLDTRTSTKDETLTTMNELRQKMLAAKRSVNLSKTIMNKRSPSKSQTKKPRGRPRVIKKTTNTDHASVKPASNENKTAKEEETDFHAHRTVKPASNKNKTAKEEETDFHAHRTVKPASNKNKTAKEEETDFHAHRTVKPASKENKTAKEEETDFHVHRTRLSTGSIFFDSELLTLSPSKLEKKIALASSTHESTGSPSTVKKRLSLSPEKMSHTKTKEKIRERIKSGPQKYSLTTGVKQCEICKKTFWKFSTYKKHLALSRSCRQLLTPQGGFQLKTGKKRALSVSPKKLDIETDATETMSKYNESTAKKARVDERQIKGTIEIDGIEIEEFELENLKEDVELQDQCQDKFDGEKTNDTIDDKNIDVENNKSVSEPKGNAQTETKDDVNANIKTRKTELHIIKPIETTLQTNEKSETEKSLESKTKNSSGELVTTKEIETEKVEQSQIKQKTEMVLQTHEISERKTNEMKTKISFLESVTKPSNVNQVEDNKLNKDSTSNSQVLYISDPQPGTSKSFLTEGNESDDGSEFSGFCEADLTERDIDISNLEHSDDAMEDIDLSDDDDKYNVDDGEEYDLSSDIDDNDDDDDIEMSYDGEAEAEKSSLGKEVDDKKDPMSDADIEQIDTAGDNEGGNGDKNTKGKVSDNGKGEIVEEIWVDKEIGLPVVEKMKNIKNRCYVLDPSNPLKLHCQNIQQVDKLIDEKTLKCLQCETSCTSMSNLRRHVIGHLGWKRYKCKICGDVGETFSCYDMSKLKLHLNRSHGEKLTTDIFSKLVCDLTKEASKKRSAKRMNTIRNRRSSGKTSGKKAVKKVPQIVSKSVVASAEDSTKSDAVNSKKEFVSNQDSNVAIKTEVGVKPLEIELEVSEKDIFTPEKDENCSEAEMEIDSDKSPLLKARMSLAKVLGDLK